MKRNKQASLRMIKVKLSLKQAVEAQRVVSLTRQPPFTSQEDFWYSFLLEAESSPGP
jgi:hypothetical protein